MFTLNCRGRMLVVDRPLVMGIINMTPDSFYEQGRQPNADSALRKAEQMLEEGAEILDIGGQSTRPGIEMISAEDELKRVIPGIQAIERRFPEALISVDTFYSLVAKEAVESGARMVNDTSGGRLDPLLIPVTASLRVPYVLMHSRGTAANMQQLTEYEDLTKDILDYFIQKTGELKIAGVIDIIVDPGFGFAKTVGQNFHLMKDLAVFSILDCPILFGISRKATVYKTIGGTAEDALNGTTVLNTIGLMNGANILRVHDVKEAREAIQLYNAYMEA